MSDVFIDKGDAQAAIQSYLHMWERIADILLLLRFLKLQQQAQSSGIGVETEDASPDIVVQHESSNNLAGSSPHAINPGIEVSQIEGSDDPIALPQNFSAPLPFASDLHSLEGSDNPIALPQKDAAPLPFAKTIQPQVPTPAELEHAKNQIIVDTVVGLTKTYGKDGHYHAEDYTISVNQNVYTVSDDKGNEVLIFQVSDNGEYHVIKNDLSFSQEHDIIASRLNIQAHGLDSITHDRTFNEQTQNLGGLAPRGSKALYVANYLLDGYHTDHLNLPGAKYSIRRDVHSTLMITRNEDGYCLLKARDGEILIANLTPEEKQGFSQIYQRSRENPAIQKQRPALSPSISVERD